MSTLYHIGRSGKEASTSILADNLRPYLEELLETGNLPPGSYWIRESHPDADPRDPGREWGTIEVNTKGRWIVRSEAGVFGTGYSFIGKVRE